MEVVHSGPPKPQGESVAMPGTHLLIIFSMVCKSYNSRCHHIPNHHKRHAVRNHRQLHCLLNSLFRLASKKLSKLSIICFWGRETQRFHNRTLRNTIHAMTSSYSNLIALSRAEPSSAKLRAFAKLWFAIEAFLHPKQMFLLRSGIRTIWIDTHSWSGTTNHVGPARFNNTSSAATNYHLVVLLQAQI